MDKSEFREALWSGLGRAMLYVRANDVQPFRNVILDACLHCHSVDPQIEGTHAPWIFDLVNLTPDPAFYHEAVLKALPACGDDWDAALSFHFARYMAMDGDARARPAMYQNFNPGPQMAEEVGIDFIELDGLYGFLFAAAKVGALLMARPKEVDEGHLFFHAIETFGEEQARDALRKAGETNQAIEAYRNKAEARRKEKASAREEIARLTYPELRLLLPELRGYRLATWGKRADAANLQLAAGDLLSAVTPEEQLARLRIFRGTAFPLHHGALIQLAASADERVAAAAAAALANITHSSVRELAFRLVENRQVGREGAISMLARNWKSGDHEIVIAWFEQEEDRDVRHVLGIDLRRCWEQHPDTPTEVRMLLTLYEKGPCSACREFVLSRLLELDSLPDSICEECAHDANDDVRRLVAGR